MNADHARERQELDPSSLTWINRHARLQAPFATPQTGEALPSPHWIATSDAAAAELGWPADWWQAPGALELPDDHLRVLPPAGQDEPSPVRGDGALAGQGPLPVEGRLLAPAPSGAVRRQDPAADASLRPRAGEHPEGAV